MSPTSFLIKLPTDCIVTLPFSSKSFLISSLKAVNSLNVFSLSLEAVKKMDGTGADRRELATSFSALLIITDKVPIPGNLQILF